MGMCNEAKTQLGNCLKAQRTKQLAYNQDNATQKRERIKQLWEDVDKNS
jgi:COX assembly mitochondrial protein 2